MRIITARDHFGSSPAQRHGAVVQRLERVGVLKELVGHPDTVRPNPVVAYINEGRWVANCPDCNGAELVTPGDPFMCLSCGNVATNHDYRAVIFPAARVEIEEELGVRSFAVNRNWIPGETPAMLRAENDLHPERIARGGR